MHFLYASDIQYSFGVGKMKFSNQIFSVQVHILMAMFSPVCWDQPDARDRTFHYFNLHVWTPFWHLYHQARFLPSSSLSGLHSVLVGFSLVYFHFLQLLHRKSDLPSQSSSYCCWLLFNSYGLCKFINSLDTNNCQTVRDYRLKVLETAQVKMLSNQEQYGLHSLHVDQLDGLRKNKITTSGQFVLQPYRIFSILTKKLLSFKILQLTIQVY